MGELLIPGKQATGVLKVDSVDLTCFLRKAAITDDGGAEIDLGTFCDPGATGRTAPKHTFEAEFRQSFTDGQTGTKAFYDTFLPLVDGATHAVVWAPFGDPGPEFKFDTQISSQPVGEFATDSSTFVNVAWGIQNLVYKAAVHT